MKGYLLDTNALIGVLFSPDLLSETAKEIVLESEDLGVSIAALWEIGIKQSIGKIDIESSAEEIEAACIKLGICVYPLKASYIDAMRKLPQIHKDPFDRIMIAQAMEEDLSLSTRDSIIPQYPHVSVMW